MNYEYSWLARVEYQDRVERFYRHLNVTTPTETKPSILEQALQIAARLLKS